MLKLMKCRSSNLIARPNILYLHPLVVQSYYHTGLQKRSVGILNQLIRRIPNILKLFLLVRYALHLYFQRRKPCACGWGLLSSSETPAKLPPLPLHGLAVFCLRLMYLSRSREYPVYLVSGDLVLDLINQTRKYWLLRYCSHLDQLEPQHAKAM